MKKYTLLYEGSDGSTEMKTFETLKEVKIFARKGLGGTWSCGPGYMVSGNGEGTITILEGMSVNELAHLLRGDQRGM